MNHLIDKKKMIIYTILDTVYNVLKINVTGFCQLFY